jgi:F-type H+-transporting ATPase subunit delta
MALSMKGASRLSLSTARTNLDKIVSGLDSSALDALSADLFFMVRVLDSSIALRRAATDNSRDDVAKVALGNQLFNSSTGKEAKALYSAMTSLRWSSPRDLGDVLEVLAIEVQSISAEKAGDSERLESEIFNFAQIVAANPQLRATFVERVTGPAAAPKSQIVTTLLTGKAAQSTISLISFLVDHPRGRSVESALAEYAEIISARKERMIAHVVSSAPLTDAQIQRLTKAISTMFGKQIRANISVDPSVLGGLSIRIGDELLDGTLISRLAQADRLLAGKSA